MKPVRARQVVVSESVLRSRPARERFEAMVARVETGSVSVLGDEELEARLRSLGPREGRRRGGLEGLEAPKELVAFAMLGAGDEVFPGYSYRELRSAGRERLERGVLCQTGVEVQSAVGCPFDCAYCPYSGFVCVRLDVEAFVERVARLALSRRSQALFKLNNRTDTLGLEPEYGLAPALVERFSALPGNYLLLYSKGEAVDGLVGLEHGGRTVASFTITPEAVARHLEASAPSPAARIDAMGRLAAAGYPVRVRLSPIVPVRGWREVYGELLGRIAAVASPELVTLWSLSMVEAHELGRIVPLEELDEDAVVAARAAAGRMKGEKGAPFPPGLRAELYREVAELAREACPTSRVALCLETPEVWRAAAGPLVPRKGGAFVCNCGPRSTPAAVREAAPRSPKRRRRPSTVS